MSDPDVPAADDERLARHAADLAAAMWAEARATRTGSERRREARLARLLDDPDGLAFVLALTDEVLRIRDSRRAARHLRRLTARMAPPRFLGPIDRSLLRAGTTLAEALPRIVLPLVKARVRRELAPFVVSGAARPLGRYIARRRGAGFRVNLNLLGEEVLGDAEAERRLQSVIGLLARPDVDYVSVKVSAVCARLVPVAFDSEVDRIAGPLRTLYRAALAYTPAKFVNLDMEAYRDLRLTAAAFRKVLDEPEFTTLSAGIVLQAYIPDSTAALVDLVEWARQRRGRGASPVKVRLVKGANLGMERVTAELAGWPQPPYPDKSEVDANYKRMLDIVLEPANRDALTVGVASHNVFETAWALTVARERGIEDMLELEMLEGMAPALAEVVRRRAGGLLLYVPVAPPGDDESSIAYLVRRFDENTGPDNFLRHQFGLAPATPAWEAEQTRFLRAVQGHRLPTVVTRMVQDRGGPTMADLDEPSDGTTAERARAVFANEPDTDFSLAANQLWVDAYLAEVSDPEPPDQVPLIPAVIGGEPIETTSTDPDIGMGIGMGIDPYRPDTPLYRWVQVDPGDVDRAATTASAAQPGWHRLGHDCRARLLHQVAAKLAEDRGNIISVMARDGGKTLDEADPEVSEAIDFCRYYAHCLDDIAAQETGGARFEPFGVVAVVPPWNFPLAIPAGSVAAALAAGNTVLLKPAPETVAVAWEMAKAFWAAGIPRKVLQFIPCADGEAGRALITHPLVDAVILTGSRDTARLFLDWRPGLRLRAETSGKNAIVITAAADLDQAVSDLVQSAFGHAGQKCSAASLAIVDATVYDDRRFLAQLGDAVRSLRPGPGWDPRTTIGPLIRPPEGPLRRALDRLDPGERWLLHPEPVDGHPQLFRPGVKVGVQPGSFFHMNECFGPVLGLMRAPNLDEAIRWQNMPAFGLTAGIESLDRAEIDRWQDTVEAGNLYVNRPITGAIVRRQPFGGWKRSTVGPGAKAGGPNYVASLGTWHARWDAGTDAFARSARADLEPSDPSGLAAESNLFRYRPIDAALLRVSTAADGEGADVHLAVAAAGAVGAKVSVSSDRPLDLGGVEVIVESDAELACRLKKVRARKLRLLGEPSDELRLAAFDAGLDVDDTAVVGVPRLEALRWVREQAVSQTRHRHGNPIQL